jgi:hypothetical protein
MYAAMAFALSSAVGPSADDGALVAFGPIFVRLRGSSETSSIEASPSGSAVFRLGCEAGGWERALEVRVGSGRGGLGIGLSVGRPRVP